MDEYKQEDDYVAEKAQLLYLHRKDNPESSATSRCSRWRRVDGHHHRVFYILALASADAAGVNIETGVNQLGFISWYSSIGDDEHGTYSARPEYYGMLAFAQAQRGQRVAINYDAAGLNLTAYAVLSCRNRLSVVVINKDASRDAGVTIAAEEHFVRANVLRLTGPSLENKVGIMLGGAPVVLIATGKPGRLSRCGLRAASAKSMCLRQVRPS
jgi:hypothetical protein